MKLRSVLVVVKKTPLTLFGVEQPDPKLLRLLAKRDPLTRDYEEAHHDTERALATVRAVLEERGIRHRFAHATTKQVVRHHQLVISVGGDGTLLDASHGAVDQPVLAVNSSPRHSVGYFCGAVAENFEERLDAILDDEAEFTELNRISITINGRRLPYPALNDVLVAHTNPAATARYTLCVGDEEEDQMSSGIWISTAAGSTAAIRAAGGVRQPLDSQDLQYLVREPYRPRHRELHLTGGIIAEPLEVLSRLHEGAVFLDGHRLRYLVGFGDRIVARCHEHPLRIFLFRQRRPNSREAGDRED